MSQTTHAISLETTFEVLSDDHRRHILQAIAEETTPAGPNIALEALLPVEKSDRPASRLRVEFQHRQLPKLADEELIDWNRNQDVVHRGQAFADVAPLLGLLDEHEEKLPGQ